MRANIAKLTEYEGMRFHYKWETLPEALQSLPAITGPDSLEELLKHLGISSITEDTWFGVFCNSQNKVVGFQQMLLKKDSSTDSIFKEIKRTFKTAVSLETLGVFILHMQPKAAYEASHTPIDKSMLDTIAAYAKLLRISVVDFLVARSVTHSSKISLYSFRENGEIPGMLG